MAKKKYIITADDYGMCPEVDRAIEQLACTKGISTTNVLTNFGTDFSNSPIKEIENFSIGIHWNVTTGKPVSNPQYIPTLVDQKGDFYSIDEFRRRFKAGLISKEQLYKELNEQYNIFYKNFGVPDYWNTHENSSLYPKEFKVFEKIALEKGIKATRNFQRVYIDYDLIGGIKRRIREFAVSTVVNIMFGIFAKKHFKMPESRIVTFVNISKTNFDRMERALRKTNKKSVEIVIHPALSGDNPLFGNIGQDRVYEYEAYMSEKFKNLFRNNDSEVVCFENL